MCLYDTCILSGNLCNVCCAVLGSQGLQCSWRDYKKALQVNKEKTIERGQAVRQTKGKCGVIYEANVTKISFPHNLFLDLALSSHHLSWPFCNIPFM